MQLSLVLSLILGITGLRLTEGCSCQPTHPQVQYCYSDYVIRANIVGKETIYPEKAPTTEAPLPTPKGSLDRRLNEPLSMSLTGQSPPDLTDPNRPTKIIYSIYIEKIYKGDEFMVPKRLVKLTTAPMGSMCGVTFLEPNQKYILSGRLSGGELSIKLCDYIQKYQDVTKRQKQGLKYHWKKECDNNCEVGICFGHFCPNDSVPEVCMLDISSEEQCEIKYARCSRIKDGECAWYGKKDFRECQKSRNRERALPFPFMP